MSGVVDGNGQQWEHCNVCGAFVRFPENLGYVKPSESHPYGRDICVKCADAGIRAGDIQFEDVTPAPSWREIEVTA